MKWVMMVIFLIAVSFQAHQTVLNFELQEADHHRVLDGIQLASQDALLAVTTDSQTQGNPEFDQTIAIQAFQNTLAANLSLDPTTLQPFPNTLLSATPTIQSQQFYDASTTSFPDSLVVYGMTMTLNQPTILFNVQVAIPSYNSGEPAVAITVPVIQSYQSVS